MKYSAYTWLRRTFFLLCLLTSLSLTAQPFAAPTFERGVNLSGFGDKRLGGLVVDARDNVYAAGYFADQLCIELDTCANSAGETDMFIISFDPDGNLRWMRTFGGAGTDKIMDLKMGPDGYLYLAGGFSQTVLFDTMLRTSQQSMDDFIRSDDACWLRMDTSGQLIDLHVISSFPWAEMIHTISVAANGRVAVGGEAVWNLAREFPTQLLCTEDSSVCLTVDTTKGTNFFVVSYDGAQEGVMGKSIARGEGIFSPNFFLGKVGVFSTGKVFVSGSLIFLLNVNGEVEWQKTLLYSRFMTHFESDSAIFISAEVNNTTTWDGLAIDPGYFLAEICDNGTLGWTYWTKQQGEFLLKDFTLTNETFYGHGQRINGFIEFDPGNPQWGDDLLLVAHNRYTGEFRWSRTAGFPQVSEYAQELTINHQNQLIIGLSYIDCNTHLDSLLLTNYACGYPAIALAWMTPDLSVGIPDLSLPNQSLVVYPNPCRNYLHLTDLPPDPTRQVRFFDSQGRELQVPKLDQDTYDTRVLSPGLYVVQVHSSNQLSTTSFIKQP